jgi:hypothetical protein
LKLIRHFDYFLANTVNLDETRLDTLEESSEAVYKALKNDAQFGPLIKRMIRQGSWAHATIIKPLPGREFDADFLLELEEVVEWSEHPKMYIVELGAALARIKRYTGMPRENKCRCVRLSYKGDFHLDIVPYVILPDGTEVIVNGDEDEWEPTNPTGFTEWMREKDEITGGNLRRVIRIMKFLRDHKGTFEGTKSIILTTILGERVQRSLLVKDPNYYSDVPTTLLHIVQDVDKWLQEQDQKPSIQDPSRSGATFDHRWNDRAYDAFRKRIHQYVDDMEAAYDEQDQERSVELWQELFGEGFKLPGSKPSSAPFVPATPIVVPPVRRGRGG